MLIEVFSDFVCPWCYIGTHRLRRALADRPERMFVRRWLPYELNPDLPPEGIERSLYTAIKFGGQYRAKQIYSVVEAAAAQEGLPLRIGRIARMPNTANAHRLVFWAERQDRADAVIWSLFTAYFGEGRDIGDIRVLCRIADDLGLDVDAARRFLESEAGFDRVRSAERMARQFDLNAVPFFLFNRRYTLSGAQDPRCFVPLFDVVEAELQTMMA